MPNPTLYDNFSRVKEWTLDKFPTKEGLAASLSDVAFSGDYNDLENKPDLSSYVTINDLNNMSYATTIYVLDKVNAIIDGAPAALDTLNELAAAINDDANFAGTITTALGNKADSADVYTKTDIQNMSYITIGDVSASGYITMSDVSACSYAAALTQAEMDTLFPITNNNE